MLKIDYATMRACLDAPDADAERALDLKYGARVGERCWAIPGGDVRQRQGPAEATTLSSRAASLVRAVTSGPTPPDVLRVRLASCFGVEEGGVGPRCPAVVEDSRGVFCSECGCPRWYLSDLRRKLRLAGTSCPRRRPGFVNAEVQRGGESLAQ